MKTSLTTFFLLVISFSWGQTQVTNNHEILKDTIGGIEISVINPEKSNRVITENTVFTIKEVEKVPEFNEGMKTFTKKVKQKMWISNADRATIKKLKLNCTFIIEKDGSLTIEHIHVNGYSVASKESFKEEAIKAINKLPKWTPGEINNKPVRTKITVEIWIKK